MGLRLKSIKQVDEVGYGVYVWQMPDGSLVGDEDGNWLSIEAKKDDIRRISELTQAVRYYGVEGGRPVYLDGHHHISDEEYQEQKTRLAWGLVPDENDVGNLADELKHGKT